jgi:predicted phage-related endonuclease
MAEIENTIKADLGDADSGICDAYKVSWKTQARRTFQTKAFAEEHPELDLSNYYQQTLSLDCYHFRRVRKRTKSMIE